MQQINEPIDQSVFEPLSRTLITGWLEEKGYLTRATDAEGRKTARSTDKGRELGIYMADRYYNDRSYTAILYDRHAQEFILANLPRIIQENAESSQAAPPADSDSIDRAYLELAHKLYE